MALICQHDYVLKLEAHSELPVQDGQFTIKNILNNILDMSHKYNLYYNHVRKVLIANEFIKLEVLENIWRRLCLLHRGRIFLIPI